MSQRLVFFTGGTALADLARTLALRNYPSAHIVTTFDSGGSSAALRKAFAIPAVGDLRNRLLALADTERVPQRVLEICKFRLPKDGDPAVLRQRLLELGKSSAQTWLELPARFSQVLRRCLNYFLAKMTAAFDPAGACLGNLMLAGTYLEHKRDFGPALSIFSSLLRCRGIVLPVVNESLHLGAVLANGRLVIGQHYFKELPFPARALFLTVHEKESGAAFPPVPCRPVVTPQAAAYLQTAGAICYPMGSFFSSVLANLLPSGVGRAVARNKCPKIFIPNSGVDPELADLDIAGQAALIMDTLGKDAPDSCPGDFLNYALVDARHGRYPGGIDQAIRNRLASMGIRLIDRSLIYEQDPQKHDSLATMLALEELAGAHV